MKCATLFLMLVSASALHAAENFGKLTLADKDAKPLKAAVAGFQEGQQAPLLVKGTVKKVCEKEGCWMTLEDQGESVRIFFKDHSFFVTQKLKDKPALAEGTLVKRKRTIEQQKHLLQDAGASAQEIAAVKADKVFFEFEATGVKAL